MCNSFFSVQFFRTKCIFIFSFFIASSAFSQLKLEADSTDFFLKYGSEGVIKQRETFFQNPDNQKFLNEFNKKFGKSFDKDTQYVALQNANVDDWEMGLFDERKKQLEFLKNYPDKDKLSADFLKFMENNIRWNYWHLLLAYPVIRSNKDTKLTRLVSLPAVMTDDLDTNKVYDEKALVADAYRDFLPFFVTYFNSKEQKFIKYSGGQGNTTTGNWLSKSMTDKAKLAQRFFKGETFDYIIAKLIYDNCGNFTAFTAKYWISQLESDNYRKVLLEHCKEALNRKEEVAKKDEKATKTKLPLGTSDYPTLTDLKGNEFNFAKYKGKVVYVDYWASWCGPCRQQFPFSKKLHEELSEKQKKNIVFLYISIDEDMDAWKNAIEKLELNNGDHGHSAGGWASEVVRKYKINGIPRYMILDKNGTIVQPDAPRPSDTTLKDLLIQLSESK